MLTYLYVVTCEILVSLTRFQEGLDALMKFWNTQEAHQPHLQILSAAGMGGEEYFLGRFPRCFQLKSEDCETHTQTCTLEFTLGPTSPPCWLPPLAAGCMLIYLALPGSLLCAGHQPRG